MASNGGGQKSATDLLPFRRDFMKMSTSDAADLLDSMDIIGKFTTQLEAIAKSNKDVAYYLTKKRTLYNPQTDKKGIQGNVIPELKELALGKDNAIKEFAKALRKIGPGKTVADAMNRPALARQGRKGVRVANSLSNLLADSFNYAYSKNPNMGLKPFDSLFATLKGGFSKKGFVKDSLSNGKGKTIPLISPLNQKYDWKTGTLKQNKKADIDRMQGWSFKNLMDDFYKKKTKSGDILDDVGFGSEIINFSDNLKFASIWVDRFGNALGKNIGDLVSIIYQAQKSFQQTFNILETGGMMTPEGWIEKQLEGLEKFISTLGSNLSFSKERSYNPAEGINAKNWVTNPDGTMSYNGRMKTYFGDTKLGQGIYGLGSKLSGTKLGGLLGKGLKAAKVFPVGAIIAAIAGVGKLIGGVFKFLAKHSPVMKAIEDLMNLFFTLFFMPIGNVLGSLLLPLMEDLIDWVLRWNDLFTDFTWEKLMDFIGSTLWAIIASVVKIITGIPKVLFDIFLNGAEGLFSIIPILLKKLFEAIGWVEGVEFIEKILEGIHTFLSGIRNFIQYIYDAICTLLDAPAEAIGGWINGVQEWASDPIGETGKWISGLFGLAEGGIIMPTPGGTIARIAEAGVPEAVIPLDGTTSLGNSYIININGDVYGISDLETKIETVINRVSNRGAYR